MRWIGPILLVLAGLIAAVLVGFYLGDQSDATDTTTGTSTETAPAPEGFSTPDPVARVTLDESGCTYEGDDSPAAPFFYMEVQNLTSVFSHVEVDRIPADVPDDEVERIIEQQEPGVVGGLPETWRLNRRAGLGTSTGSMLVGDPTFPDQMLVAGQRYVVWCSTGEPPTRIFFATIIEPSDG